jgi:hypothetical protein
MQTVYEWETCVICGASEQEYFINTGFAMLIWHTSKGPMCEVCWPDNDPDFEE